MGKLENKMETEKKKHKYRIRKQATAKSSIGIKWHSCIKISSTKTSLHYLGIQAPPSSKGL